MPIKSYRGLIGNGEVETIPLQTNNGLTGYKVVKFHLFPNDVDGSASMEDLVQVWKTLTSANAATVDCDFSDNNLLAAGYYVRSLPDAAPYVATIAEAQTIFDNEVVNQDIYVSMNTGQSGSKINYYIELEQMKLNLDEATVATLKDLRNQ